MDFIAMPTEIRVNMAQSGRANVLARRMDHAGERGGLWLGHPSKTW